MFIISAAEVTPPLIITARNASTCRIFIIVHSVYE
jgi:hypothetical protein